MTKTYSLRKPSLDAHYFALSPSSTSLSASAKTFISASRGGANDVKATEGKEQAGEEQAVRTIQEWLQRRIIKRRSTSRFNALTEMQVEVEKLGSNATIRRSVLLLGPLVYLCHALQEVQHLVRLRKTALNKELGSVDHLELDRVMREMNESRYVAG